MAVSTRRDFLAKALSCAGAGVLRRCSPPIIALTGSSTQSSLLDQPSPLYPVFYPGTGRLEHFVATESYRDSVETVIRHTKGKGRTGPLLISDRHNLNGMGSSSLMLASQTMRFSEHTIYFHSERFHRIVSRLSGEKIDNFLGALRQVDALYIDDIQFLGEHDLEAQSLFLELVNDLLSQGRQVVFTIDEVTNRKRGWLDGLQELVLVAQHVTLPYPTYTEIAEILGHKVRQDYSSTIASDIEEKLPILITQYAQKHERELPNIRMLVGIQRRVLANLMFYGTETVDDTQLEQLVKECFV